MNNKAKALRKKSTDAENLLWHHLRNRQILNAKFRRQHTIKSFVVDFVCLEQGLIIEVDGSGHMDKQQHDEKRSTYLESLGFRVLRFWNNEVLNQTQAVLERIFTELSNTPNPLPSEGRGRKL